LLGVDGDGKVHVSKPSEPEFRATVGGMGTYGEITLDYSSLAFDINYYVWSRSWQLWQTACNFTALMYVAGDVFV
jgi:hypothetical protein